MPAEPMQASVRSAAGAAVIDLKGEINSAAEGALQQAYTQAGELKPRLILLNFQDVSYINSTGIALIVNLMAHARQDGLQLASSGLSDHYKEIFHITRISDYMPDYPDEESALTGVTL